jgi:uncharacterized protein (DUF1501 family)
MKKIHSRRNFIKQASCASIGLTAFYSSILNLRAMSSASLFNSTTADCGGYKAIVCLLLAGGNDSFNMLIPRGNAEYQEYLTTRSASIAIPQDDILSITTNNQGGKLLGLHPSMVHMKDMYDNGDLAFISNVGTLVEPILNKTNFYNGIYDVPLGLYSHSDQVMHWQTSVPNERTAIGWGGKMADLLSACNNNQTISMNMSLSGSNVFQTGNTTVEYALDPYNGSTGLMGYNDPTWLVEQMRKQGTDNIIDASYQDMFKKTFIDVVKTSRDGHEMYEAALANISPFTTQFTDNDLSKSFETVAKTIAARSELGMSRQVFFIEYGGWDHHDEVVSSQAEMLTEVDNALFEFNAAMNELASSENSDINNSVTTFSVSEFARTLTSNGNGTDHAWGGNVFVMGGPVNGGNVYGSYPSLELDNPLEIGGGVLIPQLSADEYFAELALWFGVSETELSTIFPNIGNFYSPGNGNPINFMNI